MKYFFVFFIMASLAVSAAASAQDCHLASDCAANEFCINLQCAVPSENVSECQTDDDCKTFYSCDDGLCRPEGVYCKTITGSGIYTSARSTASCDRGVGQESSGMSSGTDIDCASDDPDCGMRTVDDLSDAELQDLYDNCKAELDQFCGTEIPVPENECSAEALRVCTGWLSVEEEIFESCEAEFAKKEPVNNTSTASPEPGMEPVDKDIESNDNGGDGDDGSINPASDAEARSDDANAAPQIAGIILPKGLESSLSPWEVVDCCEEFDSGDEDVAGATMLVDCIGDTMPDDCDAVWACFEEVDEAYDLGMTNISVEIAKDSLAGEADAGNGNGDDRVDNAQTADGDQEKSDADGAQTDPAPGGSSDSGCTIATPGTTVSSILSLIF